METDYHLGMSLNRQTGGWEQASNDESGYFSCSVQGGYKASVLKQFREPSKKTNSKPWSVNPQTLPKPESEVEQLPKKTTLPFTFGLQIVKPKS